MSESIEIARLLHDTPDLFPWVVLAIVLALLIKERGTIRRYISARIDAYEGRKQSDAVLAELIRNNTAALDNNTAALQSVKADRGETRRLLSYHEQASAERIHHVQEVVNRINETVTGNSRQIGIIEDRTNK